MLNAKLKHDHKVSFKWGEGEGSHRKHGLSED